VEELGEEVDTQFSVSYLVVLQQYRRDRQNKLHSLKFGHWMIARGNGSFSHMSSAPTCKDGLFLAAWSFI
jgi:hypothetical protein